jgi:hypothetical protein
MNNGVGMSTGIHALHSLRRRRQRNRLADVEWFDAAYRAYLFALFGGGGVLWVASLVGQGAVDANTVSQIDRHGPAVLGLFATLDVLVGLRTGAQGGPLALESADITYALLAPLPRRKVLARPAWQRVRSATGTTAALGAIAGNLAARRLPGSTSSWTISGAAWGATLAALWAGCALLAHARRMPLAAATTVGLALTTWQVVGVAVDTVPGPGDSLGSLAMWGWRQRPVDLLPVVVSVALCAAGLSAIGATRLDALVRRCGLVAQLRFAVTTQDLRTVILLRRQLNQERTRLRPWVPAPRRLRHTVRRRSWHGIARFAGTRLIRMAALSAMTGVALTLVVRGVIPALAIATLTAFLLGLETTEPLAQEVDHPTRLESLPGARGAIFANLLPISALALVPCSMVAAAAAWLVAERSSAAAIAVASWPLLVGGATGAVVSTVRDAPDDESSSATAVMPPEMMGFVMVTRALVPLLVTVVGLAPVGLMRAAHTAGDSLLVAAARTALGCALVTAATVVWVLCRDRFRAARQRFLAEGQAAKKAGR